MKVSELIKSIVMEAENKFGFDGSLQDCISVNIYYCDDIVHLNKWQASLIRPSKRQLSFGEVEYKHTNTIKLCEDQCEFWGDSPTLIGALQNLLDKVLAADPSDFVCK